MPAIILPSRCRVQPITSQAVIDYSNPLSRNLYLATSFYSGIAGRFYNAANPSAIIVAEDASGDVPCATSSMFGALSGIYTGTTSAAELLFPQSEMDARLVATGQGTIAAVLQSTAQDGAGNISGPLWKGNATGDGEHYPFTDGNIYLGALHPSGTRWIVSSPPSSIYEPHILMAAFKNGAQAAYFNGVSISTASAAVDPRLVNSTPARIGGNAKVYAVFFWDRFLTDLEARAFAQNPWQIFRKQSRIYFLPSAGGGATATGDLSQTLGAVTSSSAGTVDVQGALSKTLSTLSLSSTGTVDVQGALSQTLSTLTLSSTGTVDVTGTLAVTLGTLTPSASGTVSSGPIVDLTVTLANVAISSTGTVDVTGALSNTLATLTTAATGTVEVVGSSTNTLGALSISAAGTVGTTVSTGDLSQTLATLTASSTGTVSVSGTLTTTMGNLTLVAYDVEPVSSRPGTIMGGRRVVKEIDALFRAREEQALAALKRADDELLMIIALAA